MGVTVCVVIPRIHHLETMVPAWLHRQSDLTESLASFAPDEKTRRLVAAASRHSGIETRYTVCSGVRDCDPFDARGEATTARRNAVYATESRSMAVELGRNLIDNARGFERGDVTHVVFASCTGFVNPGPDYFLVKELGLSENVERYVIGFMGCYAAFPCLRMAEQFCRADPDAVVLVMCLELSSMHLKFDEATDTILGNAVFADGAGAALVSAREPEGAGTTYALRSFASATIPDSEGEMAWSVGDSGFDLVLSSYVPKLIEGEIVSILARTGLEPAEIDRWAVHPGGKSILEKVEQSLGLEPGGLVESRDVLRRYGNMSSATILFVLDEMRRTAGAGEEIGAIAFGPGLTVETARLRVEH